MLMNFWREEMGQDTIEYTLLLGFIAVATAAFVSSVSGDLITIWGAAQAQTSAAAT